MKIPKKFPSRKALKRKVQEEWAKLQDVGVLSGDQKNGKALPADRQNTSQRRRNAIAWLVLSVVIYLFQRLSHACLSISNYTLRLRNTEVSSTGQQHGEKLPADHQGSGVLSTDHLDNALLPKPQIPFWFLQNCVLTSAELKSRIIPLVVQPSASKKTQASPTEAEESHLEADKYEIESAVYDALQIVLTRPTHIVGAEHSESHDVRFKKNAMFLRVPYGEDHHGAPMFLQSIVESFSRDIGADLITLTREDIENLAQHFYAMERKSNKSEDHDSCMQFYFGDNDDKDGEEDEDDEDDEDDEGDEGDEEVASSVASESTHHPFSTILASPLLKMASTAASLSKSCSRPLVVHVPEVHRYEKARTPRYGPVKHEILEGLRDALVQDSENVLLVLSSHLLTWRANNTIPPLTGTYPFQNVLCVVPITSHAQKNLLESGRKDENYVQYKNIRAIQRRMRHVSETHKTSTIEPYTNWGSLKGSEAFAILGKDLSEEWLDLVALLIHEDYDTNHIQKVIIEAGHREEILDNWDEQHANEKWSSFPPKILAQIRDIDQHRDKFEWESRFLDCLITPEMVHEGWSDIAIESDSKDAIVQLVNQPANAGRETYGTLKTGRVGGALLYGPPGTGKTHLARVVARECQITMISVSAADIENKWVGETEKAIKGLFNLGRIVAPSVIFIDEADALFHARGSDDRSWERSRINQFLGEMDGLVRVQNAPFVLLATNFPSQLDHAVLRRAPTRVHIGLPSDVARRQIFDICLKNDKVDADVEFDGLSGLVNKTKNYSGSDIHTVCFQAALISQADKASMENDCLRILKKVHFEKALQRSAPTVSKGALANILEFAKEHDPSAWLKMKAMNELFDDDDPPNTMYV